MRLRRRKVTGPEAPEDVLYIHLAGDAAVLVSRDDGEDERWTDRDGLRAELDRHKDRPGASLLYSREAGQQDPPPEVLETFEMIADYHLPIELLEEPRAVVGESRG